VLPDASSGRIPPRHSERSRVAPTESPLAGERCSGDSLARPTRAGPGQATMTSPNLYDRIKQRAYLLWEQEGRPEGRADEHWFRAEPRWRVSTVAKRRPLARPAQANTSALPAKEPGASAGSHASHAVARVASYRRSRTVRSSDPKFPAALRPAPRSGAIGSWLRRGIARGPAELLPQAAVVGKAAVGGCLDTMAEGETRDGRS